MRIIRERKKNECSFCQCAPLRSARSARKRKTKIKTGLGRFCAYESDKIITIAYRTRSVYFIAPRRKNEERKK